MSPPPRPPAAKKAQPEHEQPKLSFRTTVSLGKPSLKTRLEAYYALVAPEQIASNNNEQWRARFDQIWDKYGGTHAGEQKLASKLAQKYGTAVRLLTAVTSGDDEDHPQRGVGRQEPMSCHPIVQQHTEEWYALNEKEKGSGCVDFLSDRFDPVAALHPRNVDEILSGAGPHVPDFVQGAPILDRVDQFRCLLPVTDPLYRLPPTSKKKQPKQHRGGDPTGAAVASSSKEGITKNSSKAPSCFAAIAALHEKGPLSVLYKAFTQRQRVRVVIRYVDGIRGTLTGYLTAFDKHMNLLMRDVDENYTPRRKRQRPSDDDDNDNKYDHSISNLQAEVQRRLRGMQAPSRTTGTRTTNDSNNGCWTNRQRHLPQILVRGDNVVAVYRAAEERSAWPVTSKSPAQSQYYPNNLPPDASLRVGTAGSLIYAAKQQRCRSSNSRRQQPPPQRGPPRQQQQSKRDYPS